MEGTTIATLIASVKDVFTGILPMVGDIADEIAGNPLLLMGCVGIPLCGIGVGLIKRLLSTSI